MSRTDEVSLEEMDSERWDEDGRLTDFGAIEAIKDGIEEMMEDRRAAREEVREGDQFVEDLEEKLGIVDDRDWEDSDDIENLRERILEELVEKLTEMVEPKVALRALAEGVLGIPFDSLFPHQKRAFMYELRRLTGKKFEDLP